MCLPRELFRLVSELPKRTSLSPAPLFWGFAPTAVGIYFERRNHLSSLLLEKFHAHRDLAVASLPPSAQRHHRKTQLTA
jgi:hypothetical protein